MATSSRVLSRYRRRMGYQQYVPAEMEGRAQYHLLTSLVVPRPIAWVSTISAEGVLNLAPHSYFNAISSDPLIIHFTSTGVKDSLTNCRSTGEFVVNLVDRSLVEPMNLTAANFPPETNEFEWAGLATTPSRFVTPPRVAATKAAFECVVDRIVSLGNGNMVFGVVRCLHVSDDVMRDGRVDPVLLDPVGRMGGATYTRAAAELFDVHRPTYKELLARRSTGG